MHVKLLQTTFSDSHRTRCPSRSRCIDNFQSFSKFLNLFPFIICTTRISVSFSETTSGEIRLWLMQPSFLRDRLHARFRTSPWSGSGRSVSNLCSCFRCIAKVFVLRVPALNLSLSSHTDALGTLQPVVIIKIVWRFGSGLILILNLIFNFLIDLRELYRRYK